MYNCSLICIFVFYCVTEVKIFLCMCMSSIFCCPSLAEGVIDILRLQTQKVLKINKTINRLDNDLIKINCWYVAHQLNINENKTRTMLFHRSKKLFSSLVDLNRMNNASAKWVVLEVNLKFKKHALKVPKTCESSTLWSYVLESV